jgi:hypothetical protein
MYGVKTQYATKDETPPLTAKQCLTIQKVTGSVFYYARAVDPTVLIPLNDIATEHTKATEEHRPPQISCRIIWQRTRTPPSGIIRPT